MTTEIITLYNEIKDNTNRFNRTPRNRWFSEKFEILKQMLPFTISKFSEIDFIITNNLEEYPTCKSCGNRVKMVNKLFCSVKCSSNDPEQILQRAKTFKKTIKANPEIIKKRSEKWKKTVAIKPKQEINEWQHKKSIARKESEANISLETKNKRSEKLSIALKKFNIGLSENERLEINNKIKESKNDPKSKQLAIDNYKHTYNLHKKAINDKKMKTRKKNGNIAKENSDFNMYSKLVRFYSEREYQLYKEYINPYNKERGKYSNSNLHHLDHIISIKHGFDNNIPIYIMSSQFNLQLLLVEDNCKKGQNCDFELEELFNKFF